MPAWLAPLLPGIITGIASVGGSLASNAANRRMSERQMAFQERMSSTAAQRAVKDYEAAGLNAALAYERPASSPGGSSATMEDVVGAGVSSGRDAMRLRQELRVMQETARKVGAEADKAEADAMVSRAQAGPWQVDGPGTPRDEWSKLTLDRLRQERAMLPINQEIADLQRRLMRTEVPGALNEAAVQEMLGKAGPLSKLFSPLLRLIRPR